MYNIDNILEKLLCVQVLIYQKHNIISVRKCINLQINLLLLLLLHV